MSKSPSRRHTVALTGDASDPATVVSPIGDVLPQGAGAMSTFVDTTAVDEVSTIGGNDDAAKLQIPTRSQIAAAWGISERQLAYATTVLKRGSPELVEAIKAGQVKNMARAADVVKRLPADQHLPAMLDPKSYKLSKAKPQNLDDCIFAAQRAIARAFTACDESEVSAVRMMMLNAIGRQAKARGWIDASTMVDIPPTNDDRNHGPDDNGGDDE